MEDTIKAVPSPCNNICLMAPDTGLCKGCFRTLDEIAAWGGLSNEAKRVIMADIENRKKNATE